MADQAGFARLWHELYDRLDTGRPEDAQKMAAAWLLVKTRDFKTGEFTLGPRYLEKRFNLSHGAAGRLILMVAETEKRLGQNRANGEPAPGHASLGAGESQAASGPSPGHDRANGGPIYRRVDVDGKQDLPHTPSSKEGGSKRSSSGARGTRIPEPFEITEAMQTWFRTNIGTDIPRQVVEAEHQQFIDHWKSASGKNSVKIDWVAAWRTWMRNAASGYSGPLSGHLRDQSRQSRGSAPRDPSDDLPWADQ